MNALLLYLLLTPALWYLSARAVLTEPLWGRVEEHFPRLGAFLACSACAGTWWGFLVGALGHEVLEMRFLGVDSHLSFLLVGLCAMTWTPVIAAAHDWALRWLAGE